MTSAQIAELVTAVMGLVGALTAYYHSLRTRDALAAHLRLHSRNAISIVRQHIGDSADDRQAGPGPGA